MRLFRGDCHDHINAEFAEHAEPTNVSADSAVSALIVGSPLIVVYQMPGTRRDLTRDAYST